MRMRVYLLLVGSLVFMAVPTFCDDPPECLDGIVVGFLSPNSCQMINLTSKPFRVAYLDKQYVTSNTAAVKKKASLGSEYAYASTCDSAKTAIPECFVASNWNTGWLGQFMWGVFSNYMGLSDSDIIAMTTLNFTDATKPNAPGSVYNGSSSFTRCVYEISLGNIDLCVGDFWETEERRNIAVFTTAIAVDQFLLVTKIKSDSSHSMFEFPPFFDEIVMPKIFRPLTVDVWVVHVGLMALAGIALFFIEGTRGYLYFGEGREAIERDDEESPPLDFNVNGLLKAACSSLIHFLWNAPQFAPRTIGGMLALFGMSAHTLILTASYTASLAAFLASPAFIQKEVSSFDNLALLVNKFESNDASVNNLVTGKLCVLQSAQGLFTSTLAPNQIVGMDNYGPMFEKLYNGQCGSAVSGRNEFLTFIQAEQMTFSICGNQSDPKGYAKCVDGTPGRSLSLYNCKCKTIPTADPLTCPTECPDYHRYRDIVLADQEGFDQWYNWALPVRTDLAEVVSSAILQSRLANDLITSRSDQLTSQVTPKYSIDGSDVSSDDGPIGVNSFVGLYIYVVILIGVALIIRFLMLIVQIVRDRRMSAMEKGKNEGGANGDEGVPNGEVPEAPHSGGKGGKEKDEVSRHLDQLSKKLEQLSEQLEHRGRIAAPPPVASTWTVGASELAYPAQTPLVAVPVPKLSDVDEELPHPAFAANVAVPASGYAVPAGAYGGNGGNAYKGNGGVGEKAKYESLGSVAAPQQVEPRGIGRHEAPPVDAHVHEGQPEVKNENFFEGFFGNFVYLFSGQPASKG